METQPANVLMEREGVQTEVCNDASVQVMEALGWALVAPVEPVEPVEPVDPAEPTEPAKRRGRPPRAEQPAEGEQA